MTNKYYKLFDIADTIDKALPQLIDIFTMYYGDDKREEITKKFNSIFVAEYYPDITVDILIRKIQSDKAAELKAFFLEKIKINFPNIEKEVSSLFTSPHLFLGNDFLPKYLEGVDLSEDADIIPKRNIAGEIGMKIFQLDYLFKDNPGLREQFIPLYKSIQKKWQDDVGYFDFYIEQEKEAKIIYEQLIEKYKLLFHKQIKSISPNNWSDKFISSISLISPSILMAFSEENQKKIDNGDILSDSILKDQCEYFKNIGIDLGSNITDYRSNPRCVHLAPSNEIVNQIEAIRMSYLAKCLTEYYQSTPKYKKVLDYISKNGYLDNDISSIISILNKHTLCISPNLKEIDGHYQCSPILFFPCQDTAYLDVGLIHELNHIYELNLTDVYKNKYVVTCGWEKIDSYYNSCDDITIKDEDEREYELINEIINEQIAQEITALMHQHGIYVFNNEEDARIKGGTSYENTLFLIEDFYNMYRDEILASRQGNVERLFAKVGKENFDRLNELFRVFNKNFTNQEFQQVINDINSGIETEKTTLFYSLLNQRNIILDDMQKYETNNFSQKIENSKSI